MQKNRLNKRKMIALLLVLALVFSYARPDTILASVVTNPESAKELSEAAVDRESELKGDDSGEASDNSADVISSEIMQETNGDQEEPQSSIEQVYSDVQLSSYVKKSGCTVTITAPYNSIPFPENELDLSVRSRDY